jgi:hypothetical protein
MNIIAFIVMGSGLIEIVMASDSYCSDLIGIVIASYRYSYGIALR